MDFDQNIFLYFYNLKKRRKEEQLTKIKNAKDAVELDSVRDSLNVFASAIFKKTVEIKHTDDFPYLSGHKIFLPKFIATEQGSEGNYLFYKLLLLHMFAVKHISGADKFSTTLDKDLAHIQAVKPLCKDYLCKEFPSYDEMIKTLTANWEEEDFITSSSEKAAPLPGFNRKTLWGKLPQKTSLIAADDDAPVGREALPEGATEKQNKKSRKIEKIKYTEEDENIGQDVFHHFEKVETLDEYKGGQREADGADDMAAHADALDELNLEEVTRSSKKTQSLYKTDLDMGFEVSDLASATTASIAQFSYDEWDEKKHQYKKNWCKVFHEKVQSNPEATHYRKKSLLEILNERHFEIQQIRKKLVQLSAEVFLRKKLFDGRQIDIDHYIRNHTYMRAGVSGDGRYYQEVIKKHRDMCMLLLVDSSLSSDSWVQNKRILDISLEALLVFGEAGGLLGDQVMVAGFNSNTRNNCQFHEWKSFEEDWSVFKNKVDHIVPEGYTRIGPAIRHATHLLNQRKEKHKILLIFTDGRPTDYDRYEGTYGLSDVRKAIKESENTGIATFAIAVDPTAKQFLPNLFGNGNFQILMDVQKLPQTLSKLYAKLAKGS